MKIDVHTHTVPIKGKTLNKSMFMRGINARGASRRFSTLAATKKKKEKDELDFLAASEQQQQQDELNEEQQQQQDDSNDFPDRSPHPPKTSLHHPSFSVHAASPLERRSRRPTIMAHVNNVTDHSSAKALADAHRDVHFKQTELMRSISHRTHSGHSSSGQQAPTRNMTRRISTSNFTVSEPSLHFKKSATWYEALSHEGPGEDITPAEIHISQANVLHSETAFVRQYAQNSKEILDLHIARNEKKDEHALHSIRHEYV